MNPQPRSLNVKTHVFVVAALILAIGAMATMTLIARAAMPDADTYPWAGPRSTPTGSPPSGSPVTPTLGTVVSSTVLHSLVNHTAVEFRSQNRPRGQTTSDNLFLILFPELAKAPGPAWLREGARATYRLESASIAQAEDAEGSAGAGLIQYDLVALNNVDAVSSARMWLDSADGSGSYVPSAVIASLGIPGVGDYWISPQVLKRAEDVANDELAVMRMTTRIGGKSFKVVRFQYQTDGAEYVWMFEEGTGLLVSYRHAIGKEDDTHRQLSSLSLIGKRQLRLPWRNGKKPAWVKAGSRLSYEGKYSVVVGDAPPTSLSYAVQSRAKQVGASWGLYQITTQLAGRTNAGADRLTGSMQLFDALWLPAEAVKALGNLNGTTLDRDPATGVELDVSREQSGEITLTEVGPLHETTLTYDRQGRLIRSSQQVRVGLATTTVQLELVSTR